MAIKTKQAKIKEILTLAKNLNRENKRWHFHMLGKDCSFNKNKGKFVIFFENEENSEYLFSIFKEKPLRQAKELADLMYGQGFLEKQEKSQKNSDFDLILKRAKEFTAKGIDWHHHHFPPNCIFSTRKGKHCIIFEDKLNNQLLTAVYDKKPMADLVKIENLFYKEL
jgi:hypothetical protein